MRYTEKDIPGMPITAFLDALGEKSVGGYGYCIDKYHPARYLLLAFGFPDENRCSSLYENYPVPDA